MPRKTNECGKSFFCEENISISENFNSEKYIMSRIFDREFQKFLDQIFGFEILKKILMFMQVSHRTNQDFF